jgi:hypothetical protein
VLYFPVCGFELPRLLKFRGSIRFRLFRVELRARTLEARLFITGRALDDFDPTVPNAIGPSRTKESSRNTINRTKRLYQTNVTIYKAAARWAREVC